MENYKGWSIEENDLKSSEYSQFNYKFCNYDFEETYRFGETIEECMIAIDFIIEENEM